MTEEMILMDIMKSYQRRKEQKAAVKLVETSPSTPSSSPTPQSPMSSPMSENYFTAPAPSVSDLLKSALAIPTAKTEPVDKNLSNATSVPIVEAKKTTSNKLEIQLLKGILLGEPKKSPTSVAQPDVEPSVLALKKLLMIAPAPTPSTPSSIPNLTKSASSSPEQSKRAPQEKKSNKKSSTKSSLPIETISQPKPKERQACISPNTTNKFASSRLLASPDPNAIPLPDFEENFFS